MTQPVTPRTADQDAEMREEWRQQLAPDALVIFEELTHLRMKCERLVRRVHRLEAEAASPEALDGLDGWSLAFRDTRTERAMQDAKWGEQNHAAEVWLAILSEEVGEMAKEMLPGGSLIRCRDEAVQVAAVAVAFVEAIDRALSSTPKEPSDG